MDPANVPAELEVRNFIRSWDNRGYLKFFGQPLATPKLLWRQIFNGVLFGWTP